MTESEQLAYILRILRLVDKGECDEIDWQFTQDGKLEFYVNCSDLFWWGCADAEDVTPENVSELERAYADVRAITNRHRYAQDLFAARVRKMRPQKPVYKDMPDALKPLFDAAGPERSDA